MTLETRGLTAADVVAVARHGASVQVSPTALDEVARTRAVAWSPARHVIAASVIATSAYTLPTPADFTAATKPASGDTGRSSR